MARFGHLVRMWPKSWFFLFLAVSGIMYAMTDGGEEGLDWPRLGRYVVSYRVKLGHRVRGSFATAAGISSRILGDIEKGRRSNYDPTTIAQLEQALGWRTGSADRVLHGGEPVAIAGDQVEVPAGDRAVVLQIIEIMATDYRPETKLTMIEDVISRDFVPDEAAAAAADQRMSA